MEFLLENKINFGGLKTSWIYSILFMIGLASCEEVVTPPDLNHPPSLVVEAYIESCFRFDTGLCYSYGILFIF